jgi:protein transport protein SEC23
METNSEESSGIKFTWNNIPNNRADLAKVVVPFGFHYTPNKKSDSVQLLEYDPLQCNSCKSVLNLHSQVNFKAKNWECAFCKSKPNFPSSYAPGRVDKRIRDSRVQTQ